MPSTDSRHKRFQEVCNTTQVPFNGTCVLLSQSPFDSALMLTSVKGQRVIADISKASSPCIEISRCRTPTNRHFAVTTLSSEVQLIRGTRLTTVHGGDSLIPLCGTEVLTMQDNTL